MRKLAPLLIILTLALPATADAGKHLPLSAGFKLKLQMADHSQTNNAGYPQTFKCVRESVTKIRCTAFAEQTLDRDIHTCRYVGTVTNRKTIKRKRGKRIVRWKTVRNLSTKSCTTVAKPYLEEADAVASIGDQGRTEFDVNVAIEKLERVTDIQFVGWVSWSQTSPSDPWGPPLFLCDADFTTDRISPTVVVTRFENQKCSIL